MAAATTSGSDGWRCQSRRSHAALHRLSSLSNCTRSAANFSSLARSPRRREKRLSIRLKSINTGLSRQNKANRGLKKIAIVPPITSGARIMVQRKPPDLGGSVPRLGRAASTVGSGVSRRGGRLKGPGNDAVSGVDAAVDASVDGCTLRTRHTVAPTWRAAPAGQRNRSCWGRPSSSTWSPGPGSMVTDPSTATPTVVASPQNPVGTSGWGRYKPGARRRRIPLSAPAIPANSITGGVRRSWFSGAIPSRAPSPRSSSEIGVSGW